MAKPRVYTTFASALITVAMNWTDRLIGIVSMVVLARLLVPEDFGIIAMASLVIAFADVLLNLGVHVPLIQNQNAEKTHYDSAWTLRLLQTMASTVALFLLAPAAAGYFQDERVELVLQILAFSLLLGGLENIGIVDFQKKMQFGAEFRFRFLRRILGFIVTISFALALRSYWALVVGMMTERALGVILSYWLHPMRPRPSFSKFREIFGVSQWMLLFNIGRYLRMKLHRILVGRWESAAVMGAYTLADDISRMPATEILSPINRALFPSFAKAKASAEKLKKQYLLAQGVQTLIAVPAAAGLALVAEEAVPIMLGEKWHSAIPFVQILALINIAQALTTSGMYVLLATGRTRVNALFIWLQVLLFGSLALTPVIQRTAMDVAWLSLCVAGVALWIQFWLLIRNLPILRAGEILRVSYRPVIGSLLMAAVILGMPLPDFGLLPVTLLVKIALGAATYCLAIVLMWLAAGRPDGAETYIMGKTERVWRPVMDRRSRP